MKFDGKRALVCTLCLKKIKGTSGTYTEGYRTMMFNSHLGKFHPETGHVAI